jgi:hypothetical protein
MNEMLDNWTELMHGLGQGGGGVLCVLYGVCGSSVWSMLLTTFALKNTILHNKA